MGGHIETAKHFLDLPYPVTLAVIPYLPASFETAKLSASLNRPFLLHMPMEPKGYPGINPGKGALLVRDSANARKLLEEALANVPGAAGLNNHMGSRATESPELMARVMEVLSARNMFFLDSMTSPKSAGVKAAQKAGIPYAARDVFIDNEKTVESVENRIGVAVAQAKKTGRAIIIGHGRPETLEALKRRTEKFSEAGIKIVPVTDLAHRYEG